MKQYEEAEIIKDIQYCINTKHYISEVFLYDILLKLTKMKRKLYVFLIMKIVIYVRNELNIIYLSQRDRIHYKNSLIVR